MKNFTSARPLAYEVLNFDCLSFIRAAGWREAFGIMDSTPGTKLRSKLLQGIAFLLLMPGVMNGLSFASGPASEPAAPTGLVLDEARAMPDASKAALADELRRFRESTGCTLYVVSTTFLSGKTIRDHANMLSGLWVPTGKGIILAYDRATDSHAIAPSQAMWETYPTPALVEAFREAGSLLQAKDVPLEKRIIGGSGQLTKRITEAEQQRRLHSQLLPGHDLWAALVFFGLLVAGAIACGLIVSRLQKRDAANAIRYFFPQADVAMRFGAPYGGGVIAEVRVSHPHP